MKRGMIQMALVAVAASAAPALANAITNGGFETASSTSPFVTDWLPNGVAGGTTNTYTRDTLTPHSGTADEIITGSSQGGGANAALFQITAPGTVAGNTAYNLDFFAKVSTVGPSGVQFYQVLYFDSSNNVLGSTGSQNITGNAAAYTENLIPLTTPVNTDHVQVEFDAIVGAINGSSSTIQLDDVSLNPVNSPEPASIGLLGAGLGSVLMRRRRA